MINRIEPGRLTWAPFGWTEHQVGIFGVSTEIQIIEPPHRAMRIGSKGRFVDYAESDLKSPGLAGIAEPPGARQMIYPRPLMERALRLEPGQKIEIQGSYYVLFNNDENEMPRAVRARFIVREFTPIVNEPPK